MRMNEIDFDGMPPIDGYGPGFFRIAGEVIKGDILMMPSGPKPWGGFDDLETIIAEAKGMDVLFIGMGADIGHPPVEVKEALSRAGIAFEAMGTSPACRTYNVLLSEGRRVAAALLAV